MSKFLKPTEVGSILHKLVVGDEIDDSDTYRRLLIAVGDVIADYCGGTCINASYNEDGGWLVRFSADKSLPDDGGVYKNYDPDVEWVNGEEL